MDFSQVKELIALVDASTLKNLELIIDNVSVKMSKNDNISLEKPAVQMPAPPPVAVQQVTEVKQLSSQEQREEEKKEAKGQIVKSPIVGTFYESTGPGKPALVKKGDKVKAGDILCIVEAMKIMNEITSPFDGEIAEILVENEALVEYGQPLFQII